mmetsp:Transcript_11415/g.36532  ORF Transcript_11415/g.36532 Transcript_11415/m.36532 type:complete len:405 (-) Transcript_11415:1105-2319(-)
MRVQVERAPPAVPPAHDDECGGESYDDEDPNAMPTRGGVPHGLVVAPLPAACAAGAHECAAQQAAGRLQWHRVTLGTLATHESVVQVREGVGQRDEGGGADGSRGAEGKAAAGRDVPRGRGSHGGAGCEAEGSGHVVGDGGERVQGIREAEQAAQHVHFGSGRRKRAIGHAGPAAPPLGIGRPAERVVRCVRALAVREDECRLAEGDQAAQQRRQGQSKHRLPAGGCLIRPHGGGQQSEQPRLPWAVGRRPATGGRSTCCCSRCVACFGAALRRGERQKLRRRSLNAGVQAVQGCGGGGGRLERRQSCARAEHGGAEQRLGGPQRQRHVKQPRALRRVSPSGRGPQRHGCGEGREWVKAEQVARGVGAAARSAVGCGRGQRASSQHACHMASQRVSRGRNGNRA